MSEIDQLDVKLSLDEIYKMSEVSVSVSDHVWRQGENPQQSVPYNLSSSAKSELQYKIEQRFIAKDGPRSPSNKRTSPYPQQGSPKPRSPAPREPTPLSNSDRGTPIDKGGGATEVTYTNEQHLEYTDEGNRAAMHLTQNGLSEDNIAAMALTHQENLDTHHNGIRTEEEGGMTAQRIVKMENVNEDALNYSTEGHVYTQLGGPEVQNDSRQAPLTTIDPSYLNAHSNTEQNGQESSHSVLSAALRRGYTVHNLTSLNQGNQVTSISSFDNPGHLLPQADVEEFFSSMERPMATTVSLSGMYSTGSGSYTTLTNPPGLTLAQTYQGTNGNGGTLVTLQPPSYTENSSDYGLTQLYGSRGVSVQYLQGDGTNSPSPTPHSNSQWGVSQTAYCHSPSGTSLTNQVHKYSYHSGSPTSRDVITDNSMSAQYQHPQVITAGASTYPNYLTQDLNSGSWYSDSSSPYSEIRPTGKYSN